MAGQVTAVVLPLSVWNRVLRSVVRDGHRMIRRAKERDEPVNEGELRQLAEASSAIGDAIAAPDHRRFRFE